MISEAGSNDKRGSVGGNDRLVRKVVREKVMGALNKMKGGKATGL